MKATEVLSVASTTAPHARLETPAFATTVGRSGLAGAVVSITIVVALDLRLPDASRAGSVTMALFVSASLIVTPDGSVKEFTPI